MSGNPNSNVELTIMEVPVASHFFLIRDAAADDGVKRLLLFCNRLRATMTEWLLSGLVALSDAIDQHKFLKSLYDDQDRQGLLDDGDHDHYRALLRQMEQLILCHGAYHERGDLVLDELQRLMLLTQNLIDLHKEHGDQIFKEYAALRQLTVIMKCLDNIWMDLRGAWKEFARADGEITELSKNKFVFEMPIIDDKGNECGIVNRTLEELMAESI